MVKLRNPFLMMGEMPKSLHSQRLLYPAQKSTTPKTSGPQESARRGSRAFVSIVPSASYIPPSALSYALLASPLLCTSAVLLLPRHARAERTPPHLIQFPSSWFPFPRWTLSLAKEESRLLVARCPQRRELRAGGVADRQGAEGG